MPKYDFFVAGRWRNYEAVREVLEIIRDSGKTAYCFIDNLYEGEKLEFDPKDVEPTISGLEKLSQDDELIKKIFDKDMAGEKSADNFLLVLPAGISGHVEAGVAYGLGKPCYAVGRPEKTETLYNIFDKIFLTNDDLREWLA
jgi:nucleoside 2-deoxyribosyltransferase